MRRAHVILMTSRRLSPLAAVAALIVAATLAGCTSTGTTTGSGSVRGGAGSGWENFRADAGITTSERVS